MASIFSNIFAAIGNFFKKEAPVFENALSIANNYVNIAKTFLGSATGQTLEAVIDALAPGVGPLVFAGLNTFFTDFGLIDTELNGSKTPPEIAADGFNALAKLTGNSKILALSNVASVIGNVVNVANGGTEPLQQHIVAAPVVYDPAILNAPVTTTNGIVDAPVGEILPNGNQVLSPNA